ncbi:lysosomal alpha-mannosidase [Tribolium castaneum]|uniref:Alpha-mannosidase n=1 Tax=Tribolium castaneum TaxID=7070 RepID=D6WWY7_TRICA|nr:PREDICTED: lysosomal alpha-mannosidase [Tribolium castaneum]XP_015838088.1 PREDICTED: lysosomal alpha-mannosidase [Tribolium castaneum]EFA08765.1 Alpha-mannosidase 2-like Protein [Tribolium castaneum]|eukprot:XP_015838087.1 PREDICTED: lysosomal alpha-mannosidase [Tribolium castaneum]
MFAKFLKIALFINLVLCKPPKRLSDTIPATCHACHPIAPEKINIHLVPHSHDDVGWVKTTEQYYYGSKKKVQFAGVQYIISSTIEALKRNPKRRFIQVESVFFSKWWQNQDETLRQEVIEMVKRGQLEIVNGAWTMNDEADTNYQSIIDQFTWGFRFLDDNLGKCARPKVGWQIDSFGHSREHASILTQMGFQGLVIGRLDHRDKEKRQQEKNLDFVWQASANLNNSAIFTTMFPEFYVSIECFCFDILCDDEMINDDVKSPEFNLNEKVYMFSQAMDQFKEYYKTNNILLPMGGDFTYQAAEINFSNIDKLIKGFQGHKKYNVFYSTPSCYIAAVNEEVNRKGIKLRTKTDDFFPYSLTRDAFWTGYYTSRPTLKRFERVGNNILQAVKQLTTFSRIKGKDKSYFIDNLRGAMGIMQHHDAITGTEREAVAKDYVKMLNKAIREAETPIGMIIGDLLKKNLHEVDLHLTTCLLANVSICETTKKAKFVVTVYNPLSRSVNHYVRLPVEGTSYKITGPDGEEEYDIFESISSFDYITEETKPSARELVFAARNIPPLGLKLYYVELVEGFDHLRPFEHVTDEYYGSECDGFTIDNASGMLSSITIRELTLNITQEFFYYSGYSKFRPSGAYVFRPQDPLPKQFKSRKVTVKAAKGKLADEVLQIYNSEVSQIIRVYKNGEGYVEFDWLVGNLQTHGLGKEVITRFEVPGLKNKGVFFTDSNGREQIKRELNKRSDYEYDPRNEPVSSNYYPVTSKIVIKDVENDLEVAVLNDRAQGGTSLKDGVIELMVHRKLVRDDGYGVEEVLREREYHRGLYARGQHYLVFGFVGNDVKTEKSISAYERDLANQKLLAPWILVADATKEKINSLEKTRKLINFQFNGLTKSLPENVKILTLEPWRDNTYILRLEHTLEEDEDWVLSQKVIVDLENLFSTFSICEIGETTLGANQWLGDYAEEEKLIWNDKLPTPWTKLNPNDPLKIELNPMQIRTFLIKVDTK